MSSNYNNASFIPTKGKCDQTNKHGINMTDIRRRLVSLDKNMRDFRPKELARILVKMANELDHEATILQAQKLDLANNPHKA